MIYILIIYRRKIGLYPDLCEYNDGAETKSKMAAISAFLEIVTPSN
jgi:hypothetical protein